MTALPAAQVEDAVVALEPDAADQETDFISSIAIVFDNIAVGFEVEGVEQRAPPVRRQVTLEIRNRAQCSRAAASVLLRIVKTGIVRAGAPRVRLGSGSDAVGFLAHLG